MHTQFKDEFQGPDKNFTFLKDKNDLTYSWFQS